ncbi:DEAD/DEAH box helicase family protein [Candidatus Palauibacter sp.]|uniref:DEAD/DEAH box helicase family protein n=1 Tax=Candidatus Palauibacter sp. TaxID=3101350 RepID=UPI003C6F8F64
MTPGRPGTMLRRLEAELLLLGWANRQFGFETNQALFDALKDAHEGYEDGRSHVARMLLSRERLMVPADDLARYDDNVRRHLDSINKGRREPITLRYFQQLAALYAELFLARRAASPEALARQLHRYVREKVHGLGTSYPVREITPDDLNKLAFWMATGSGKTLIMHLNYLQFLHYGGAEGLDNIILITPNEGLSAQHMEEMTTSGIPSARLGEAGLLAGGRCTVRVTEITKLVDKRRGKGTGVSIEVEAFGDRNLVFVDEGHRGASGEAWRAVRDAVAARGFTFEYSATFGQALAAARDNQLTLDYGKSILFDYSYPYFHRDGFGKDFRVLNVSGKDPPPELADHLLFGNLLSFYEQLRAYRENAAELRAYNLEQPLWVFVGKSVNAVYRRRGRDTSDVLAVQLFLHRVLNEPDWARETIGKLLRGESGLYAAWNVDLFADRFNELAKLGESPDRIYADILRTVFHADGPGGLRLCDIRGAPGELGLKASGSDDYFGLTYIGDTAKFKRLAREAEAGIIFEEDAVGGSMFGRVNEAGATVNVLIGAKKFVEGWNSWRVSNMGLMKVGQAEGSEIIQLFGRGVRLKGRGMSLKRSTYLEGPHPDKVGLLETLNIFAVRADYMKKFRTYLEREGLEARDSVTLRVPVRANEEFLGRGLVVPALPEGTDFETEANFALGAGAGLPVQIDRATRASSWESGARGQSATEGTAGHSRPASELPLALVDWERAYLDLMEHRRQKGMRPLAVPGPDALRSLVESGAATVSADEHVFEPRNWHDREDLQAIVHAVLRRTADRCWQTERRTWEAERMKYREVDAADPNLLLNVDPEAASAWPGGPQPHYVVSVPHADAGLRNELVELIEQRGKLYEQELGPLARIHFDRHLYQPLLIESSNADVRISPPPLNESEKRFVRDLRDWWVDRGSALHPGAELFLLRNQGRGCGVGFSLEGRGFYPDFILWLIEGGHQRVVFVEPHGMLHARAYAEDEKARLHERLSALSDAIAERSGVPAGTVSLDAFIVSATPHAELRPHYDDGSWSPEDFASKNILFPDPRRRYMETLLARP